MMANVEVFLFLVTLNFGIVYCGQQCLSCTGIRDPIHCRKTVQCHVDEVCFLHNYTTDDGLNHFDLGCTYPDLCPPGRTKRVDEGHHMICHSCCNETNICNMDLMCDHTGNGGSTIHKLQTECEDLSISLSGVYTIYPYGPFHPVPVYCIVENNKKWTVIQRRYVGKVNFYRGWSEYKDGFGLAEEEYWLGNENIHVISRTSAHEMSVYLEDFEGAHKVANYSFVSFGDEWNYYKLYVTGYTGDAGDTLSFSNGMPFSTFDRDNRNNNCPVKHHGGWWYSSCGYSNLNGGYGGGPTADETGMFWYSWHGLKYSYKITQIMIRRK